MIDAAAILAAHLARAGEEDVLERTKDQQDPVEAQQQGVSADHGVKAHPLAGMRQTYPLGRG